jgi:hypothetical protein
VWWQRCWAMEESLVQHVTVCVREGMSCEEVGGYKGQCASVRVCACL